MEVKDRLPRSCQKQDQELGLRASTELLNYQQRIIEDNHSLQEEDAHHPIRKNTDWLKVVLITK